MKGLKTLGVAITSLMLLAAVGCGGSTPAPTPEPEVVHVTGITSTEEGFSLSVDETHELVYTVAPADATNKAVTFSTESEFVTVSETGVVTGVAEGEATVVATTVDGGFTVTYTITVKAPTTGMDPSEIIDGLSGWFGGNPVEVETGVFGLYSAYDASDPENSVEKVSNYASMVMEYMYAEFTIETEWATDDEGCVSATYANEVSTVVEFYVYPDSLWVDAEGKIVSEGTEGATEVAVTAVEIYSYTSL